MCPSSTTSSSGWTALPIPMVFWCWIYFKTRQLRTLHAGPHSTRYAGSAASRRDGSNICLNCLVFAYTLIVLLRSRCWKFLTHTNSFFFPSQPYGAFALSFVVLYVLSANIMAPFFSEDFTGNTQLHFPVLYNIWTRTTSLVIVLVRTFATKVHRAYLAVILVVSVADAFLLLFSQQELCHVKWFKNLKAAVSFTLAWSAICSLIQGTLPVALLVIDFYHCVVCSGRNSEF